MKLPDGTKRTLAGVIGIITTFAVAKGWIDADTATMIASLNVLLLGAGVVHAITKKK